jgi:multidrug resistance efflux pump
MKTIKRILAVFLLIVAVVLVGYLIFTGSQLTTTDTGGIYETIKSI